MSDLLREKDLVKSGPQKKPKINTAIIEMGDIPTVKIAPDIRVGSVPYLNAKPLTRFISSHVTKVEPVQLAADLRADKLDVALVPLLEVMEAPADMYRIVDKLAIGSEREVFSVYLNYSVPLAKIETVALDPASKTSVELARLVLEKFHHLKPRYVATGEQADAQLLIGDPAIAHRQAQPEQNYLDLATAWREQTSLPFVFAVWAVRLPYWKARSVAGQLRSAAKLGLSWRDAIAKTPFERHYLTDHLCYDLGPRQKEAIHLFGEMMTQSGRLAALPKLSYV
jgi:predicted solute-binding protein